MNATGRRGLEYAIDYMKAFAPLRLVPDAIYKRAGITGLVSSLGHSLRREARKPDNTNRVNVSYSPDSSGRDVAFYTYNTDYRPPERPTSFYFFTLKNTNVPSPYMPDIQSVLNAPMYSKGCRVWSGTYERPVLVEVE